MKKFLNQPTNYLIVESVIFLTVYLTLGNGIVSSIMQENVMYLFYSVAGWVMQLVVSVILVIILSGVLTVVLALVKKAELTKKKG